MTACRSTAPEPASRRVVRAACPHDCPDTCAMLVTVENGRAIEIRGAPDHPPTAGTLCTKVARYLDRTYSPDRLRYPMRRVGAKGEGRFARISWDEALDEIAERFRAIAASADGPQAILPYSYAGTMGLLQGSSMDRRFFHRLGASLLDRTICSAAGKAGWGAVIGASMGMDLEEYVDSRLILIWGSNPVASNLHFWTRAQEAKRRGAQADRDRPLSQRDGREVPRAHRAAARHRRRARVRHHARADRRATDRSRLRRPLHASASTRWPSARANGRRSAWRATCGIDAEQVIGLARDYGTIDAGRDSPELRHAARARRRQRACARSRACPR